MISSILSEVTLATRSHSRPPSLLLIRIWFVAGNRFISSTPKALWAVQTSRSLEGHRLVAWEPRLQSPRQRRRNVAFSGSCCRQVKWWHCCGDGLFWGATNAVCPFRWLTLCLLSRIQQRRGEEMGGGQVKTPQTSLLSQFERFSVFVLSNFSLECCKLLVNFRRLEKVDSDNQASLLLSQSELT